MPGAAGRQRPLPAALAVAVLGAVLMLACSRAEAPSGSQAPADGSARPEPEPAAPGPAVPATPPDAPSAPEAPRAPASPPSVPPAGSPAPAAPEEPAPPPLGLEELERRLKETRAIGVFTKLALKGDIDDLLAALRAHHERGEHTLAKLRERFDVLVMKVLSLLQDDDPGLAAAVARSREGLWNLLADPREFARVAE